MNPASCTSTTFEDLIDMLPAVLVCRLKILKLLAQVLNVRFELRCLRRQSLVNFSHRAEHKPANRMSTIRSRDQPFLALGSTAQYPMTGKCNDM